MARTLLATTTRPRRNLWARTMALLGVLALWVMIVLWSHVKSPNSLLRRYSSLSRGSDPFSSTSSDRTRSVPRLGEILVVASKTLGGILFWSTGEENTFTTTTTQTAKSVSPLLLAHQDTTDASKNSIIPGGEKDPPSLYPFPRTTTKKNPAPSPLAASPSSWTPPPPSGPSLSSSSSSSSLIRPHLPPAPPISSSTIPPTKQQLAVMTTKMMNTSGLFMTTVAPAGVAGPQALARSSFKRDDPAQHPHLPPVNDRDPWTFLREYQVAATTTDKDPPTGHVWVYKMMGPGLGSQLMNLFTKLYYLQDLYNKDSVIVIMPVVVESHYPYRLNETVGVLTGFFTPQFLVLDHPDQHAYLDPYFLTFPPNHPLHQVTLSTYEGGRIAHDPQDPIWLSTVADHRAAIKQHFNTTSVDFYHNLSQVMCPHLQFNKETRLRLSWIRDYLQWPDLSTRRGPSVAFHVRRTDKLFRESLLYPGRAYVDRFLRALQSDSLAASSSSSYYLSPYDHFPICYVATDDVEAVDEMKAALQEANMTCTVYSLATRALNPYTRSSSLQEIWTLMMELSVMIEATYFIGTFNSNLGALVAILRSCRHRRHLPEGPDPVPSAPEEVETTGNSTASWWASLSSSEWSLEHYARSYGVDRDAWYFR